MLFLIRLRNLYQPLEEKLGLDSAQPEAEHCCPEVSLHFYFILEIVLELELWCALVIFNS